MKNLIVRIVNIVLILGILVGYNQVIYTRKANENKAYKKAKKEAMEYAKENNISSGYKDGTYTGEAEGFGGPVDLELVIKDGQIEEINITSAKQEDQAYLSMAMDIIDDIIEAQSADVDTISGATFSSTGIKNAVSNALESAR